MNCKKIEEWFLPFIKNELDVEQLEKFLKHIESCLICRDELEIYYMLYAEIDGLDNDDTPIFDPSGILELKIQEAKKKVQFNYRYTVWKYALTTLAIIGMILTFFVQMRLWV